MSMALRSSMGSHAAAMAFGAVAVAMLPSAYLAQPHMLADYIAAICAKTFHAASAAETSYLADNASAMTKMMIDMDIRPSGDIDSDFVAMMVPHHQGAIEMAQALSHKLRAAEGRISELEAQAAAYQEQAERAEQWLHRVYSEIEDRFLKQGDRRGAMTGAPRRNG